MNQTLGKSLSKAIDALAPFGPTPIVATVLGVAGLTALSLHADPAATVLIVIGSFFVHIYGQERKAIWRRRELEAEFDALQKVEEQGALKKLQRRLNHTKARDQPSLFDQAEG